MLRNIVNRDGFDKEKVRDFLNCEDIEIECAYCSNECKRW